MELKLKLKTIFKWFIIATLMLQSLISLKLGNLPYITLPRILLVIAYVWILFMPDIQREFIALAKKCNYNMAIIVYLLVCLYTAIFRRDINTFFGFFVDCFFVFYLFLYILEYYISIDNFMQMLTACIYIVCILGLIEFFTEFNIFTEVFIGEANAIEASYRDSVLRICGPYGHPLAYGMVLILFFPLTCYSYEENSINIFKNKILFILVILNMFATGGRSGIGLFGLELILLYMFTSKQYKGAAFLNIVAIIGILVCIGSVLYNTELVQYCLRQLSYVVDELLGTNMSLLYGGDSSISASSIARERIWKIFYDNSLNPWLGKGTSSIGSYQIDNWLVTSIDNFYVRTYISFGVFGVIAVFILFFGFLFKNFFEFIKTKNSGLLICLISVGLYMINLLYVDELATFKYFFLIMSITVNIVMRQNISYVENDQVE